MGRRLFLVIFGLLATAPPVGAETIAPEAEYAHCMTLARAKPERGLQEATRWESFGGGPPALHCRATALIGLRQWEEAAALLDNLAATSPATASLKVALLQQAADAWANGGQNRSALRDLEEALKIAPDNADGLESKALLLSDMGLSDAAIGALTAAIAHQPTRLSAWVLRAAAYRRSGHLDQALLDLAHAENLNPQDTDLWLEKGAVALALGNRPQARKAWLHVLEIRSDGTAARAARDNLAKLDVTGN